MELELEQNTGSPRKRNRMSTTKPRQPRSMDLPKVGFRKRMKDSGKPLKTKKYVNPTFNDSKLNRIENKVNQGQQRLDDIGVKRIDAINQGAKQIQQIKDAQKAQQKSSRDSIRQGILEGLGQVVSSSRLFNPIKRIATSVGSTVKGIQNYHNNQVAKQNERNIQQQNISSINKNTNQAMKVLNKEYQEQNAKQQALNAQKAELEKQKKAFDEAQKAMSLMGLDKGVYAAATNVPPQKISNKRSKI